MYAGLRLIDKSIDRTEMRIRYLREIQPDQSGREKCLGGDPIAVWVEREEKILGILKRARRECREKGGSALCGASFEIVDP